MAEIKMARILCAVDFSEYSQYALRYAVELAKLFDAEMLLLNVLELAFVPTYAMAGLPELSLPTEQIERDTQQRMDELIAECSAQHKKTCGTVRIGTPFVEIIRYAREIGADLIVVGTHGRTGLRHVFIGSVAERVVRKAPCPVLSVKHPKHTFEMP
jgi:nucleotide-binding universal stress UspA family protein